jgi:hypothetical protein
MKGGYQPVRAQGAAGGPLSARPLGYSLMGVNAQSIATITSDALMTA